MRGLQGMGHAACRGHHHHRPAERADGADRSEPAAAPESNPEVVVELRQRRGTKEIIIRSRWDVIALFPQGDKQSVPIGSKVLVSAAVLARLRGV